MLRQLDDPKALPRLPASAKAAARRLLLSKPVYHQLSSWTYLSQLHGPKVSRCCGMPARHRSGSCGWA